MKEGRGPSVLPSDTRDPTKKKDGAGVMLPQQLEQVAAATELPRERHRWNTNEEIAGILIAFSEHEKWLTNEVIERPASGSMLLFSRQTVPYRRDGYFWKRRKDNKTTREDHMKLKVQGVDCIYGSYVHSAIIPTFHRRCYWLLKEPDVVLVHYLNVPLGDDTRLPLPSLLPAAAGPDRRTWTEQELTDELSPMFASQAQCKDGGDSKAQMITEMVGAIVQQLLQSQRRLLSGATTAPPAECLCNAALGTCHVCRAAAAGTCTKSPTPVATGGKATTGTDKLAPKVAGQTAGERKLSSGRNSKGRVGGRGGRSLSPKPPSSDQKSPSGGSTSYVINTGTGGGRPGQPLAAGAPMVLNISQLSQLQGSQSLIILSSQSPSALLHGNHQPITAHYQAGGGNKPNHQVSLLKSSQPSNAGSHGYGGGDRGQQRSLLKSPVIMDTSPAPRSLLKSPVSMEINSDNSCSQSHQDSRKMELDPSAGGGDMGQLLSAPSSPILNFDLDDLLNGLHDDENDVKDAAVTTTPVSMATTCSNCHLGGGGGTSSSSSMATVGNGHSAVTNITDFSPEWASTEGGTKVLITGPWYAANSNYSVMFGTQSVPAQLLQTGVLRCLTPAHMAGQVPLQVACDGYTISNSCVFEFRHQQMCVQDRLRQWLNTLPVDDVRSWLVKRLREIESRLHLGTNPILPLGESGACESRLVERVREMSACGWARPCDLPTAGPRRLSLLHLATIAGYQRLVSALIKWRCERSSLLLEYEVDAFCIDENACTPMVWACGLDNSSMAAILYKWQPSCLNVCQQDGVLPLGIARLLGHDGVTGTLEALEMQRRQGSLVAGPASSAGVAAAGGKGSYYLIMPKGSSLTQADYSTSLLTQQTNPGSQYLLTTATALTSAQVSPSVTTMATSNMAPQATNNMTASSATVTNMAANMAADPGSQWANAGGLHIEIPPSPQFKVPGRHADSLPGSLMRRASDAGTGHLTRRSRLLKRISVEVLPDYPVGPSAGGSLDPLAPGGNLTPGGLKVSRSENLILGPGEQGQQPAQHSHNNAGQAFTQTDSQAYSQTFTQASSDGQAGNHAYTEAYAADGHAYSSLTESQAGSQAYSLTDTQPDQLSFDIMNSHTDAADLIMSLTDSQVDALANSHSFGQTQDLAASEAFAQMQDMTHKQQAFSKELSMNQSQNLADSPAFSQAQEPVAGEQSFSQSQEESKIQQANSLLSAAIADKNFVDSAMNQSNSHSFNQVGAIQIDSQAAASHMSQDNAASFMNSQSNTVSDAQNFLIDTHSMSQTDSNAGQGQSLGHIHRGEEEVKDEGSDLINHLNGKQGQGHEDLGQGEGGVCRGHPQGEVLSSSSNDPMLSMATPRDLHSPILFMQTGDGQMEAGLLMEECQRLQDSIVAMETDSPLPPCGSMEHLSPGRPDTDDGPDASDSHQMETLANQIIAAMPEHIKLCPAASPPPHRRLRGGSEDAGADMGAPGADTARRDRSSSYSSFDSVGSVGRLSPPSSSAPPGGGCAAAAEDSGFSTPLEGLPQLDDYRYPPPDLDLSPVSSSLGGQQPCSPYSFSQGPLDSPPLPGGGGTSSGGGGSGGLPTAEEFYEYFNAPNTFLEKDFSQLTLSESEQRKLYEAAKIIQSFYRQYKDRKEQQHRQKEAEAAILIQSYYRRYKQYIYFKKMTQAAVLIQTQFRSYYAQKRFRQSREAATVIQNRYRAYKEQERFRQRKHAAVLIQQRFRSHYQRKRGKLAGGKADDSCRRRGSAGCAAVAGKATKATATSSSKEASSANSHDADSADVTEKDGQEDKEQPSQEDKG